MKSLASIEKAEKKEEKRKDREWADAVKNRDGWRCCICNLPKSPNAHHIIPRENKAARWDIDNGLSLCIDHHLFSRTISAHQNPFAFFLWLAKHRPVQFAKARKRSIEIAAEKEIDLGII